MPEIQNQTVSPQTPPPPPRKFHPADGVYALLSLVFGFFFLKYTFASAPGIALSIATAFFIIATFVYAALRKKAPPVASYLWALILLAFTLTYPLTENGFLKGWCVFFELLAGSYWIYLTFGNRSAKITDDMLGFDLIKSLILLPFGNLHKFFGALADAGKKSKPSRTILFVLLGLAIALIPTVLVFVLLSTGDSLFSSLIEYLFSDLGDAVGNNIACAVFALPLGILIFGLLFGAAEGKFRALLSRKQKDDVTSLFRFASPIVTCAALTPMLLTYLLFFISQVGYFMNAFQNIRPENYTYAEYAREGFFNLVAVCAINGLVILAVHFLTKRTGKHGYSWIGKIYVILFALSSIFLAIIALRKMLMYIEQYGLTLSRVYASWFMILLSVFFLILILKQLIHRLNGIFAGTMAFLLLFGGLCLCNVDARVAEYNLNRYIVAESKIGIDLDYDMFYYDLSDAAIVAVDEAYDQLDEKGKTFADQYFLRCASRMSRKLAQKESADRTYRKNYSFRSWNWDTARAEEILRKRCPEQFEATRPIYGWTW